MLNLAGWGRALSRKHSRLQKWNEVNCWAYDPSHPVAAQGTLGHPWLTHLSLPDARVAPFCVSEEGAEPAPRCLWLGCWEYGNKLYAVTDHHQKKQIKICSGSNTVHWLQLKCQRFTCLVHDANPGWLFRRLCVCCCFAHMALVQKPDFYFNLNVWTPVTKEKQSYSSSSLVMKIFISAYYCTGWAWSRLPTQLLHCETSCLYKLDLHMLCLYR